MPNSIDLAGKKAVATGGAQDIGRAIVARLLQSGPTVALWDRDGALGDRAAGELARFGPTVAIGCDGRAIY